jgi:ribosome maturation factor RimP
MCPLFLFLAIVVQLRLRICDRRVRLAPSHDATRTAGRLGGGGQPDLDMPPANVVDAVRAMASRVAASHGLEIFDVQFRREASGMVLRVQIDRPGPAATAEESVSVADCAVVSRDLSAVLDVEDAVPTAYTLEVSSPGLDRPLRQEDDYRRFAGRCAKIVLREKIDGQGYFKGRLAGVDGHDLFIDADDGRRHRVPIGVITRANLEVEF